MHRINVNASLYHEDPVRRESTPTVRLRAQSTLLGALSFQLLSISGQAKPFFTNATPTAKLRITPLLLWFYLKSCANLKNFMNSGSQAYLNYKNFLIFQSDQTHIFPQLFLSFLPRNNHDIKRDHVHSSIQPGTRSPIPSTNSFCKLIDRS